MIREIIAIDEALCDGCGLCVTACAEGALVIRDGKARLVSETYCDGLGACLGECPQGAITITRREAPEFDEAAVEARLAATGAGEQARGNGQDHAVMHEGAHGHDHAHVQGGCPGSAHRRRTVDADERSTVGGAGPRASLLGQWPVQLKLLNPAAPFLKGSDLLVAADCVGFAMRDFQDALLANRTIAIACPKLDDGGGYVEKLTAIIRDADIRSVTVAIMEVPCCRGLQMLVERAVAASGRDVPVNVRVVSVDGELMT